MRTLKYSLISAAFAFTLILTSCEDKKETVEPNDTVEQSTNASDGFSFQQESDQVANETENLFSSSNTLREEESLTICGLLSIDTLTTKSYLLKFNGRTCDGKRRREGNILVTLTGSSWSTLGSNISIDFQNYKVTRSDGKYLILNGQIAVTNVNGGLVSSLRIGSPAVVHNIMSNNLTLTFDDASVRTWSTSRKRTFTRSAIGLEVKTEGTGLINGLTNAAFWGKNRKGNDFYSLYTIPLKLNQCSTNWKITSGHIINKSAKDIDVTFGLNAEGKAAEGCNVTHYNIQWLTLKGTLESSLVGL